jgi:hypothetical protein
MFLAGRCSDSFKMFARSRDNHSENWRYPLNGPVGRDRLAYKTSSTLTMLSSSSSAWKRPFQNNNNNMPMSGGVAASASQNTVTSSHVLRSCTVAHYKLLVPFNALG